MATIFSHSIAALAFGKVFPWERKRTTFWILTAVCAALPDIDVIGFSFGVHYGDMLGHRGFTHSLAFALIIGCLVALIAFRDVKLFSTDWWKIAIYFFIVTASHGVLDAMTNGGLGVAFFSPFSNTRYFFSWRPIQVSPIGLDVLFSGPSWLISEIKWIWIPAAVLVATVSVYRKLITDKSDGAP